MSLPVVLSAASHGDAANHSGGDGRELGGLANVCARLRLVDLRSNKVSAVGVGLIVDALRSNRLLEVQQVYVSSEGASRAPLQLASLHSSATLRHVWPAVLCVSRLLLVYSQSLVYLAPW